MKKISFDHLARCHGNLSNYNSLVERERSPKLSTASTVGVQYGRQQPQDAIIGLKSQSSRKESDINLAA